MNSRTTHALVSYTKPIIIMSLLSDNILPTQVYDFS